MKGIESIDYSGYKIIYFPEGFSLGENPLLDKQTQIKVFKGNKEVVILDFIIPFKERFGGNLKTQEIINIAIKKVKQIIDSGFRNNELREFEFMGTAFEEIIN